ncbi:MAG: tetratricopeptide repeat protein [Saprospiraceae bacterium]
MKLLINSAFVLLIGIVSYSSLIGQQLNTPKEFQDIMNYSPIEYYNIEGTNQSTFEVLQTPTFSASVSTLNGSRKLQKALRKGNKFYKRKKWTKALKHYQKALDIDKNNIWLLRRIGQLFLMTKEYKTAFEYIDKVLIINQFDFEALAIKADCQVGLKEFGVATRTITLAHLYNRNNTILQKKMKAIALLDKYEYDDSWQFDFNYKIEKIEKDKIRITAPNVIWKAYANCKAVWEFDANYVKAKQNDFPTKLDLLEEKECLLNFLISFESVDIKYRNMVKPLAPKLVETIDNKMINAFIQYEIWAVQDPQLMHKLTKEELDQIIMYIFTIRTALVSHR